MNQTQLPLDDRGLAYGDGLFETVLVRDGQPQLWEYHLARLRRGCQVLGMVPPPEAELNHLPAQLSDGLRVLKLIYTRGSGGRGYAPPVSAEPRLVWQSSDFAPDRQRWQGVSVRLCRTRLARQPLLAGIKHMARLENVLARGEWQDSRVAEGLMMDIEGLVVEATSMNVFWSPQASTALPVFTPPLDQCGVAGTLRQALMDSAMVEEHSLTAGRLAHCAALWVGNSVQGIWPVTRLEDADGRELGRWQVGQLHRDFQHQAHLALGYSDR
ncbi:aminodeoxychorismate lyase [Halomonas huangheensis]|uniref:Aminodeoxychorismate lyase n=1 Tax=Halomonas huangheensis TaxID=1178482 RepID=W1N2K2_9GAMM|nr:aminodeoxychorismate lyase [Halomonas huangheensis]ALM52176.1 4-amino-4-deoxychorismate lyase [Halomonas huangheensis]ERL49391.1 hypothetical protein BJB45_06325 [Halomonas huangheensis]